MKWNMNMTIKLTCLTVLIFGSAVQAMDVNKEQLGAKLFEAAKHHNFQMVESLLLQGAPVDARYNHGNTPLMVAAFFAGSTDICKLLLLNNAQVNAKNNTNSTPLLFATTNDTAEVCELLLAHNARVDIKNNEGTTPLLRATRILNPNICKCLIDAMICKQYAFQKNKQAIIAFLSLRKKSKLHHLIAKDMVHYIANMAFDIATEDKVDALAQINAIEIDEVKNTYLNYYHKQLEACQ